MAIRQLVSQFASLLRELPGYICEEQNDGCGQGKEMEHPNLVKTKCNFFEGISGLQILVFLMLW